MCKLGKDGVSTRKRGCEYRLEGMTKKEERYCISNKDPVSREPIKPPRTTATVPING